MGKSVVILQGSPKKDGNTAALARWVSEGARKMLARVEIVDIASLKYKSGGCISCRVCQTTDKYECAIDDDARPVLSRMAGSDVIVMATPLYFFGPSAQLKALFDRMFSLYKWDNKTGFFTTPLRGKTFALVASAYEDVGLDVLEKPFRITADYTGMKFESLLIPNAGISGGIKDRSDIRRKAVEFGERIAS